MLSAGPEISQAHETGNPEFAAVEKDPESLEEIPVRVRHRIGFGRLVEMFPAMHRKPLSCCCNVPVLGIYISALTVMSAHLKQGRTREVCRGGSGVAPTLTY